MRVEGRSIIFKGKGPFDLRAIKEVNAAPRGNAIVLSFRVRISPTREEVLRIAFPSNRVRKLVTEIRDAKAKINAAGGQLPEALA